MQGSVETLTQLRCDASDGIFRNHFITNLPQNLLIKNLRNAVTNIWWRYGQKFASYFFDPPCISVIKNRQT